MIPRAALVLLLLSGAAAVAAHQPTAALIASSVEQGGTAIGRAPAGAVALTLDGRPIPIAADGAFLVAFDRDAAPQATIDATLADGRHVRRDIAVRRRAWRIERVNAPYRAGKTDAEFAALRPAELARIAAARALPVESDGWRQRFAWPARGRQSGWFGSQRIYQGKPGSYHGGADLAVPPGTPVRAPADGVVILAADVPFTLEGKMVMIGHGMGLSSALLHLSRIAVRQGQRIRQGDVIGASGATGRVTGPHLHWGMTWGTARLDPLLAAGPMPR